MLALNEERIAPVTSSNRALRLPWRDVNVKMAESPSEECSPPNLEVFVIRCLLDYNPIRWSCCACLEPAVITTQEAAERTEAVVHTLNSAAIWTLPDLREKKWPASLAPSTAKRLRAKLYGTNQGYSEYWLNRTLWRVRESPAYKSLPSNLGKSKLNKAALADLLARWCTMQGNIYVLGTVQFWACLPLWSLQRSLVYRDWKFAGKAKLSHAQLCRALAAECGMLLPRS